MDEKTSRGLLEHRYSRLGLDPARLVPTHNGTIVDVPLEAHDRSTISGLAETLGFLAAAAPSGAPASEAPPPETRVPIDATALKVGPVVGMGGMGIVNVAEQTALRREVAVKRIRPERVSPGAINALLREAWVTGALEHPNVVPIHLLVDDEDAPRVVMKRVEGVTWDTLIEAPHLAAELGAPGGTSANELLPFHLRILDEVSRAVHFAHSRGVLHLDLKPENVMVGHFGEVYLVDWGIAASLPGGPVWLPAAHGIRSVRGTPSWMSPELATADGEKIGVATDVYLLGGLLHAILTHNGARHEGVEVIDILAHAFMSEPYAYGATVPEELAALANRATAPDPADRPASAESFRRAILGFLEHRHSTELEAIASDKKESLVAFFERSQRGPAENTQVGQTIRRDFLEARFGFRQALEIWPENAKAREGLQTLLRAMGGFALDNEQLERAAESISELSPRDPELDRRLRALAQELSDRHQRLVALERDASLDAFREKRGQLSLGIGVIFILWNFTCGFLERSGIVHFEPIHLVIFDFITGSLAVGVAYVMRKTLLSTATNRRVLLLFASGFFAIMAFWVGAFVHGQVHPDRALRALEIIGFSNWGYTFFLLAVAVCVDRRAAWIAIPVTIIATVGPLFERYAFEVLGSLGFICGASLAFIWRRSSEKTPRPGAEHRR